MALRNQEIGARLRELRGSKPQTTVAEELGVAERTYQNWEAGDTKPSYRNLQRLAEYHGVGEEFILAGLGDPPKPTETPNPFPSSTEGALAEVLAAITAQLVAQTEVLNEVKDVLLRVETLLGRDTETADRLGVVSETLGGTAAQLDAQVQQVIASLESAPVPKRRAARTTAPKSNHPA